jgi:glycosyltransferase involved in cell wall biosynthesis
MNQSLAPPNVSVIMTVYDGVRAPELVEAVDSILAQTLPDFEFLIMKDGIVREDLLAYLDDLARRDSRVKLFANPQRSGIAYSLNRLVEQSAGKYLARMDADDVSLPNRFQEQVTYLDQHPTTFMLGSFAQEIDEAGKVLFEKRMPTDFESVRRFMSRRDPFIHPTVMFRRSFFERCGLYNENPKYSYLEDTELWSRAILAGLECVNLPTALFLFRINQSFIGRRRGLRFTLHELLLRIRYCWKAGLPLQYLAAPVAVFLVRMSPTAVTRFAYKQLRK